MNELNQNDLQKSLVGVKKKAMGLSVDSPVEQFAALRQAMLQPSVLLGLTRKQQQQLQEDLKQIHSVSLPTDESSNLVLKLLDEVKTTFADFYSNLHQMREWNRLLTESPAPEPMKLSFFLLFSRLFQSFILIHEPLLELMHIAQVCSSNWAFKLSAVSSVEDQYFRQKSLLDTAIKKMEYMKAQHEKFRREQIILLWERLVRKRIRTIVSNQKSSSKSSENGKIKANNVPSHGENESVSKAPSVAMVGIQNTLNRAFNNIINMHHPSYGVPVFKVSEAIQTRDYISIGKNKSFKWQKLDGSPRSRRKSVTGPSRTFPLSHYRLNSFSIVNDLKISGATPKTTFSPVLTHETGENADPKGQEEKAKTFTLEEVMEMSVMHLSQLQDLKSKQSQELKQIRRQCELQIDALRKELQDQRQQQQQQEDKKQNSVFKHLERKVETKDVAVNTDKVQPVTRQKSLKKTTSPYVAVALKTPAVHTAINKVHFTPQNAADENNSVIAKKEVPVPDLMPEVNLTQEFEENDVETRDFFIRLHKFMRMKEVRHENRVEERDKRERRLTETRIRTLLHQSDKSAEADQTTLQIKGQKSMMEEFDEILKERLPLADMWIPKSLPKKAETEFSRLTVEGDKIKVKTCDLIKPKNPPSTNLTIINLYEIAKILARRQRKMAASIDDGKQH